MSFLSGKKLLLLGFVVVLLVIIPLTVYLVQQQQKLKAGATPATTIAFVNPTRSVNVGDTFTFDISLNPGSNQISFVKLTINWDATKLQLTPTPNCTFDATKSLCPNTSVFPSVLQGPTENSGSATVTLSVGGSASNIISSNQPSIAKITFKALTAGTAPVSFGSDSQALSISSSDQFNENVLLPTQPGSVTIAGAGTPTPTPTPTPSPTPGGSTNKAPVCSGLTIDRQVSGTAPYSLTFTASGTDSDGTITKATFNFGDGGVSDVTTGGGIGTSSVNAQISHTYNNAGTFQAKATLTDNQGGTSTDACGQTITVSSGQSTGGAGGTSTGGSGGTGGTGTGTGTTQTATVGTPTPTPATIATIGQGGQTTKGGLPVVGPGDNIRNFGILGIVSTIIGALLLFGL